MIEGQDKKTNAELTAMFEEAKVLKIANDAVWFYHNAEDRCKGCGKWRCQSDKPHAPDCPYGELLRRVTENKDGGG